MSLYRMILVSVLCLVGLLNNVQSCAKGCRCYPDTKKASCELANTNIPKLPSYINLLILNKSNYTVLEKKYLQNLTPISIQNIKFIQCDIKNFSSDVFKDLEHLLRVYIIRSNSISTTAISDINFNSTKLEELHFIKNQWTSLPEQMFNKAKGSNITRVSISGNNYDKIPKNVFSGLDKLHVLNLTHNKILQDISFQGMPVSVTELSLRKNSLLKFPKLCVNETESYLPFLEILNLKDNHISYMQLSSIECMENLKELNLKGNELKIIKKNIFRALPKLSVLNLSKQSVAVRRIENYAFDSQSLSILLFEENNFIFHSDEGIKMFSECSNLTHLDLSKNHLKYNSTSIRTLFLPLQNLRTLILAETKLTSLPIEVFPHMSALRELILTGNDITGWNNDPRVFGNVNWLRKLSINKNKIKFINKTSFSKSMLSSLDLLDLSDNRFSCSCRLRWFRNWIDNNGSQILKKWPKKYICKYPPIITGTYLGDFNISEDECVKPNPVIIAAIVLSALIFVTVIVAIIVDNYCRTDDD